MTKNKRLLIKLAKLGVLKTEPIKTGEISDFDTFEKFFEAYKTQEAYFISLMVNADNAIDVAHGERCPLPFQSCMVEDCIGRGKSLQEGGAIYNFTGPQGFGIANMTDALIAAEEARVEDARKVAYAKIEEMQNQIRSCLNALERIKETNRPTGAAPFDYDMMESSKSTDAMADEISANLQALVGTTEDIAPKAEPRHPASDTTTKYANLRFGKNYDPMNKL